MYYNFYTDILYKNRNTLLLNILGISSEYLNFKFVQLYTLENSEYINQPC